jgi:thiol-disulfide isomerase/thioredoxin
MAFEIIPASKLVVPLELVLRPTSIVTAACVFEGLGNATGVSAAVVDHEGRRLAIVHASTRIEGNSLTAHFRFALPPGEYMLNSRGSDYYPPFSIPLSIKPGEREADFGTMPVVTSGLFRLRGQPAPELKVKWRAGAESALADMRGNVVVLDFWGYWCVPCVREMPQLMDIAERFKDQPVKWVAIHDPSLSSFEELDQQLAGFETDAWGGRKLSLTTVIDLPEKEGDETGVTGIQYGVQRWPTLVLIDQQGRVAGPAIKDDLTERIEALLKD